VRGVIIATVAVIFVVAAGEAGMDIRDGRTPDPGLAVAVALSPAPLPPSVEAAAQVVPPLP
jgi:hypothetical protein